MITTDKIPLTIRKIGNLLLVLFRSWNARNYMSMERIVFIRYILWIRVWNEFVLYNEILRNLISSNSFHLSEISVTYDQWTSIGITVSYYLGRGVGGIIIPTKTCLKLFYREKN